jgi:hypothetical protein
MWYFFNKGLQNPASTLEMYEANYYYYVGSVMKFYFVMYFAS